MSIGLGARVWDKAVRSTRLPERQPLSEVDIPGTPTIQIDYEQIVIVR